MSLPSRLPLRLSTRLCTGFTVVIERRWARLLVAACAAGALVLGAFNTGVVYAAGQGGPHQHKFSRDLGDELRGNGAPKAPWARNLQGVRHVQLLLVGDGADAQMTELRQYVQSLGGTVLAVHPAAHAMTVQVKASLVDLLAQRGDVLNVVPNRATRRTASTLETITGALANPGRTASTKTTYTGVDGTGIGIAILDSGVMRDHRAFYGGTAGNRVKRNVNMLNTAVANWVADAAGATSLQPGSAALASYEAAVANDSAVNQDAYGHGTHVASVAAGVAKQYVYAGDTTGIAPNASIYDVKVLGGTGTGTLSDAIEGIQWVIYHAKEYNIRVLNISLATDSSDSWELDPLCIAARSAVSAGITVVVAAGNFGKNALGSEVYGAIGSPGNDPSVITVGAVNFKDTQARGDDSVNLFSSRGPTRGAKLDLNGRTRIDNLLKPDLVAPGNRIVGAAATANTGLTWNLLATQFNSQLVVPVGITQVLGETQMLMSGTSIAAPAVAGTVALMLQTNPGLTPPLIKAMLQYSAQPIAGQNLLQQGTGLLNVSGALALAKIVRTDLSTVVANGTLAAGSSMLAAGQAMPATTSSIGGASFNWSRLAFVGGNRVVSGASLFTKYQPLWDPRLTWANGMVRKRMPVYWSGTGIAANTFIKSFTDVDPPNQTLVTAAVVDLTVLAGTSSMVGKTGAFLPTATLSSWATSGSGTVLLQGVLLSSGLVLSEGLVVSEGLILSEGLVVSEGLIVSEGLVLSEGLVVSEGFVAGEP